MAAAVTAGVLPDNSYGIPSSTMANVSILNNPAANTLSSAFPVSPISTFPSNSSLDSLSGINGQSDSTQTSTEVIIEALRSKDRLFVLKLGEQMETLITERKTRIDTTPATSYQRLLVHKCSAYYRLTPEPDQASKSIIVHWTTESKIPSRRISELAPLEETAQPAFKIMRRNFQDRHRLKPHVSHSGSIAADEPDLSDIDPSETGSQGGRSNTTGSSKKYMTIEEREAAYNEARSRIFMDFEEKEKLKDKDMSASSSTFSLVSGSASTSASVCRDSGSVGDLDDSVSTAATESEWSGPAARDKSRRNGSGNNSAGSSSRSLRSFNANGGSSRGSRATSPSFSYASLYEPPPAPYEASQYMGPPMGYIPSYMYPFPPPPPGQAPAQPMMPAYPYYPPYPYHHPQQPPQHSHSDPTSPAGADHMFAHPPHLHSPSLAYQPQYMWPPQGQHPPPQPPQPVQNAPLIHPVSATSPTSHNHNPQAQNVHYPVSFMPPPPSAPYGPYVMPYYQPHPPAAQGPPLQPFHGPQLYPPMMNGQNGQSGQNGVGGTNGANAESHRRNGTGGGNGAGRRNTPPKVRSTWSSGPGASMGGHPFATDTVGPRLSTVMKRTSGHSSAGSSGNRTPGDEASSTASSSTTSSSSRHTYTSTSSKHPLPPRPDWAVGLKAEPTLSHHRHHDQNNSNVHSPSASHNVMLPQSNLQQLPPVFFQSTDFPPLSNMTSPPEKRAPAGAWTKASSTKSIMTPGPSNGVPHGNVLVHYPNGINQEGCDRPPLKGNGESVGKGAKRQNNGVSQEKVRRDAQDYAVVDKLEKMALREDTVAECAVEETVAPQEDSWDQSGENSVER